MKPYRVEYVQLAGWETDKVGLWLAENDDWLLLRHIPVDYMLDGYVLLSKAHIASRKPGKDRKQVEQVLKLKGAKAEVPVGFRFQDTLGLLHWVEQHYGLVEFVDEEETTFFGWIRQADSVHFWLDALWSDGNTELGEGKKPFLLSAIQHISFDTDYFNSMKLLWQHKQHLARRKLSQN